MLHKQVEPEDRHRVLAPVSQSGDANPSYTIHEHPLGTARKVRIVIVGAGASGLNAIKTFRERLTNFESVVYEKNPSVGGTCWASFFSPAKEIEGYLCRLCEDEHMLEEIKLEHEVVGAYWDEKAALWKVTVNSVASGIVFHDHCDFLLNANGILNNWQWPDIPGLHDFQGTLLHSANWNEAFDWAGKRVAVIGNGSSGVQIVPSMQESARELIHFIREPTWIVPPRLQSLALTKAAGVLSQIEMDDEENFTTEQIQKFKADPIFYTKFVKAIEEQVNSNFFIVRSQE
ncbi:hypothetical protein KJ359_003789 [Pestalotiopsis sp. 9143b]|nr:hypothetical protein KJ359_003789 [Pestalotiopsis sp. 9143b]